MSVQLLDKTRKINKLLHNNNSSKVVFNDICAVLTEILNSNVLVVSKKGKILGVSKSAHVDAINELIVESVGAHIDEMLNERLLKCTFYQRECEIWRHLVFHRKKCRDIRQLSSPLILRENALEHSLFISRMSCIPLMISS